MSLTLILVVALLLAVLTLVSYADGVYSEAGKFLAREFQENIEAYEQRVEPRLKVGRTRAAVSMAVLAQLTTASIAVIVAFDVFRDGRWSGLEIAQAAVAIILGIVIFNRLLPYVLFVKTKGEWVAWFTWPLRILIYLALPVTLMLGFGRSVAALTREHPPEQGESSTEAVDALIEAGQEEGILEEGDRALIQSVVEFGDKTVREVMTPRPEIIALPVKTTVEQFTELLRTKPYSRVPVYEGNIDQVRGIVMAHDVLQIADTDARLRTVQELMRPAFFVPETQRVSALLREMQKENLHMAIVIDEYGSVAGVVTIEDMVEEIVGEIRDEHEAKADVVRENDHSYLVPGNMDVDRLGELFGVRPETREASTVAGLVSEVSGHIPGRGEVVEREGLRFEVLESTNRRVERLRISQPKQAASQQQKVRA